MNMNTIIFRRRGGKAPDSIGDKNVTYFDIMATKVSTNMDHIPNY